MEHSCDQNPRVYSYVRFSTPEQAKGDSHRRQTEAAARYAVQRGLELDTELTFEDLGVSGYRGKNAETGRLGDFLELVRAGRVARGSTLVVESLDRISRQAARKALRTLEDIVEEGVAVVTLADGKEYTSESSIRTTSLIMAILIFIRANEESTMKATRLRAAWEGKRKNAGSRPLTARTPGWIRLNREAGAFELVEDRAAVVRRVFNLTLAGIGQEKIAETLNREGVPTFGGAASQWRRSYIKKLLDSPAVCGTLVPHQLNYANGKRRRTALQSIEGYYPAVVSKETFIEASAGRLENRAAYQRKSRGLTYIFAALAKCPKCGDTMTRVNKGAGTKGGKPRLVCARAKTGAGCEYRSVPQEFAEWPVLNRWQELTDAAPAGHGDLRAQFEAADANLSALLELIHDSADELVRTHSPSLRVKVVELEAAYIREEAARDDLLRRFLATYPAMLSKRLDDLRRLCTAPEIDVPRLNLTLRQLFSRVVVDYDAAVLRFTWKQGGETSLIMPHLVFDTLKAGAAA